MPATWLADALRAEGCRVDETLVPDWHERGHPGTFTPLGVLLHHTAGPATGNLPSLPVVRDGRADLPGPLAQLMLARDGTWVPIAAGLAWHAGEGSAPWVPGGAGNRYLIGIEAESVGTRDDWTPAQREAYPLGVAALCRHLGAPAAHVLGHREWAPTRKVDPAFWDLDEFRAHVDTCLCAAPLPAGALTSSGIGKDEPMAPIPLPVNPDRTFRAAFMAEAGEGSQAVAQAWITYGSTWGNSTVTITALDAAGKVLNRRERAVVKNNTRGVFDVPSGCALATIEGTVDGAATIPVAALVSKAR